MSNRTRRTLTVLCLSLALCLPLHAQRAPALVDNTLSAFLPALWARLSVSLTSLWAKDETDGRGAVDPDGRTAPTGSRGACDPDGAPACGN